jgi:hypothetical protein
MTDAALNTIRTIREESHLPVFANRLIRWLVNDLNGSDSDSLDAAPAFAEAFTGSRAKALLRVTEVIDDPTLQDFGRLMQTPALVRIALYDLLKETALGDEPEVQALAAVGANVEEEPAVSWPVLAIAAYAWKSGYMLNQLDPASPPGPYSPAGQVLKRTAQFMRRQVQRSATDRDKLGRKLNQPPSGAANLETISPQEPVAPLPPHYRPPVPVRYPEVARETVQVDPNEPLPDQRPVVRGEPLVITEDDLAPPARPASPPQQPPTQPEPEQPVTRMPPISISRDQIAPEQPERRQPPRPMPQAAVLMPNSSVESRPSLTMAIRQMLGQEEMTTTKLRVLVQDYPDGPGLYGLQVRVTCAGIKSYVAGTTDRDGKFVCELPVRLQTGLTYDVEITWPRDKGGDGERKSITLNADRTEFTLPFYRKLEAE